MRMLWMREYSDMIVLRIKAIKRKFVEKSDVRYEPIVWDREEPLKTTKKDLYINAL